MKKNLWIWALAALSMTACTSEDAPSQDQVVTENDFESPDGRIVVQLGAENSASVSVSRAPIEGTNITVLQDLGIFALNRNNTVTFTSADITGTGWLQNDDCLLMNVKAAGASNGTNDDGSPKEVDPLDPGINLGKKITLYKPDESQDGAVYYYPMQGDQNYNFYGYQPREGSTLALADNGKKIQVKMVLDGDKDLITGINNGITTEQETDYNKKGCAPTVFEKELYSTEATESSAAMKETEAYDFYDGYNAKYIRKIKYHNWIIDESQKLRNETYQLSDDEKKPFIPKLEFVHRLTKLNFQIITAKKQAGDGKEDTPEDKDEQGDDKLDALKLRVRDVQLKNVQAETALTIEPAMTLTFGGTANLAMKLDNTDDQTLWVYEGENGGTRTDKIIPQVYEEGATYKSAGYLMVPATADKTNNATDPYIISLVVIAKDQNGEPQEQTVELSLKDQTFLAGKSYNIQIALYAQQEVYVNATLTDWESGADVYLPVE